MQYTTNLKLSKPSYDDDVDIQIINNNMDIIDDKIKKASEIDLSQYALKKDYLPLAGGTMTGNIQLGNLIGLLFSNKSSINFSNTDEKETLNMSADKLNCSIGGKPFVIEGDSITYDGADLITALSNGGNGSGGYVKLSNGMTVQWGFIPFKDSATIYNQVITFNTPMKTDNYIVMIARGYQHQATIDTVADKFGDYQYAYEYSTTGFKYSIYQGYCKSAYVWLAIGGI